MSYLGYKVDTMNNLEPFWAFFLAVISFIHMFIPEDVLSDSRESWDILIVDNICMQRGLSHQIRPCQ